MPLDLVIVLGFAVTIVVVVFAIHHQGKRTMADLTALTAQVQANTSVEQSAVTLIQGIASQLAAAGIDPTKLAALQSQLSTSATALAAAVAANTVAAPPTT
jgi:tryptophanyl-tRNA synthetase